MKFVLFALAAALLALPVLPGHAADPGTAAIAAIGRINGMALACEQPAIASRARNAVTTTAPKTRASGEAFENATHAAYLEQGKGAPCPDTAALNAALGDAEKKLQAAFPAPR
ncbi:MAG: hypothetical protein MUE59_14230 [Thiobacillaceae bacterium]|nr:hypothetical protein [Thiobacillaceae bacterium]